MNANDLREDILDLINEALEHGLPYWEVYGVVSSVEKFVELCYKADLVNQAKGSGDES